jgi:diguanylate cyclase (GGDEF)-like protein/PAS domain S-box-containing protein
MLIASEQAALRVNPMLKRSGLNSAIVYLDQQDSDERSLFNSALCNYPAFVRGILMHLDPDTPKADLSQSQDYSHLVSQFAHDGLVVQNLDGIILWANHAYCNTFGYDLRDVIGRNPLSFCMLPDDQPPQSEINAFRYDPATQPSISLHRNRHKSGRAFWMQISISFSPQHNGDDLCILVCRDVSEQIHKEHELKKKTEALKLLADCDPLTHLANHASLKRSLDRTLESDPDQYTGVLQIDMDDFKQINDTHGHAVGDAVLINIALALQSAMRQSDFAARMGGDEFVVICPDVAGFAELEIIAANLAQAIRKPIRTHDLTLDCNPSIGAALIKNMTLPSDEALRRADLALYDAKHKPDGAISLYDDAFHSHVQAEMQLAHELRAAVAARRLTYFFQPTLSLRSGDIIGFETLVRWQHPRLGMITPDTFLPLAKRLGLMAELDFGAIQAAIDMKHLLNKSGYTQIKVALNGSEDLLKHPNLLKRLAAMMSKKAITPDGIVIELLESVVFDDTAQSNPLVSTVKKLHDAGFSTLLDDFGTGYAGLAHLAKLAVNGVKIDRSLTANLTPETISTKIIDMIIDLCSDLNFHVITEGVETAEQAATLREMGADEIQGYWLSKPMPPDQALAWLRSRPDHLAQLSINT